MKKLAPVVLCLIGCAGESAPGAALMARPLPPTSPEVQVIDEVPPADEGCRYTNSVEPTWPAEPEDDCYREWTGTDGVPLVWAHTQVSEHGTTTRWVRESFVAPGTLITREVRQEGPHGVVFASYQRLDLPPHGTLPDTYGQPATFSQHWIRDAAGRVVRQEHDVGLDGVDVAEEWDYAGETLIEHRRYHEHELVERETFRPDGQPLERFTQGSRRVWSYGPTGLLEQETQYHDEVVFETIDWVMQDPERPLERTIVRTGADNPVSRDFWTWDEQGRLRVQEGMRRVYGYERHHRREFDDLGRETRYVEDTEDNDCHRYEQVSTWLGETDDLLHSRTTCDGRDYQTIAHTYDHAARPLRYERHFYGNPSKPSHEVRTWVRDACGAVAALTSTWGEATTRLETREHDAWGRITRRELIQHGGEPRVTDYSYDDAGRLTRAGSQTWTWTAEGRLGAIGWNDGAPVPFVEGTAINLRFVYSCAE